MNMKNLFDQFVGSGGVDSAQGALNNFLGQNNDTSGNSANNNTGGSRFPGGVAGGLAAGGIVSLLMGSKTARKYAGKAATIGGAAMLGGAAFKLYQNWQQNQNQPQHDPQQQSQGQTVSQPVETIQPLPNTLQTEASDNYQMTLIKAMIASAKADGHIDQDEQGKIFDAVETLGLPASEKGMIFDLLSKPISVMDIAQDIQNDEQKTEVYLASCIVGEMDHPAERKHLDDLAMVLNLPTALKQSIEAQVSKGLLESQ